MFFVLFQEDYYPPEWLFDGYNQDILDDDDQEDILCPSASPRPSFSAKSVPSTPSQADIDKINKELEEAGKQQAYEALEDFKVLTYLNFLRFFKFIWWDIHILYDIIYA